MFSPPPNKKDVVTALEALRNIERPEGDNEGDPINSPSVYPSLSPQDQAKVDHAEEVAKEKLGLVNPDEILLKPNK